MHIKGLAFSRGLFGRGGEGCLDPQDWVVSIVHEVCSSSARKALLCDNAYESEPPIALRTKSLVPCCICPQPGTRSRAGAHCTTSRHGSGMCGGGT